MLVVIPTAGIGSRLDLFTRYFNKSMIQLGDTPVISKIIDSYPSNTKFIIATGYKGDHIIEYLNLVYPQKNIKIVRIKKFQGPGSSLTLTLKKCLGYINKPFIFHANDSIFTDKKFYKNLKNDTMFISRKDCNTMKYATVEIKNNFKKVNNKLTYLRKDFYNYTGVSYVADFKKFKKIIEESTSNEGELEYFKSLDAKKIKFIFIKNWFDIGSKTTKETAEKYFIKKSILPKYDQGIFFKNQMVYKFFVNSKITKSRAVRSKLLYPYVPKIIKRKKYFYIYRYVNGKVFSHVENKKDKFMSLLNWLNDKFWVRKNLSNSKMNFFKQKCNSFYYEKSLSRVNYLYEKYNIKDEKDLINGKNVDKISNLFDKINWEMLSDGVPVRFHGDLHFENIIKNKNKISLLDWREDFSGVKNYGDLYYDLAKINHGLIIDHSIIRYDKFNIIISGKKKKISFHRPSENKQCQKIFFRFLKQNGFNIKKVKILTALIFLNSSGLHHYPYSIFLYYLGKSLLSDYLKK